MQKCQVYLTLIWNLITSCGKVVLTHKIAVIENPNRCFTKEE